MDVSSIKGSIELDASGYKKGLDEAQKATQRFASESARATQDCAKFMAGLERESQAITRNALAAQQNAALTKLLGQEHARLSSIEAGEDKILQALTAQYNRADDALRDQVAEVQRAIAAHEAEAKAIAKSAAEVERYPAKLRAMGAAMQQVGRSLTQSITLPLVAAGAGLLKAGVDVDHALDQIRIATGATGERLQGLEASFKAVGSSVPNSLEDVGKAIGAVATRTGLTGPPLEALTKRLLTMQRLMGGDLAGTLELSTRLFGDWGVKVGNQSKVLDLLGRAHQMTGISIGKLSRELVQFGAPLRTVGFSLAQSIALFGKWNKEGVNAEQVATSLRIGISRMVKAGVADVPAAMQQAIRAIHDAKTPTDALALSFKLFGARAGTDMARAIREGRFEIDGLVKTLTTGKGTLNDTGKEVDSFQQRFKTLANAVEIALNPLSTRLMDALDRLAVALKAQVGGLDRFIAAFNSLPSPVQKASEALLLIVAGVPLAIGALGKLIGAWGAMKAVLASAELQAAATWLAVSGPEVGAILLIIGGVAAAWHTNFLNIRTGMQKFGEDLTHLVAQARSNFQQIASLWADAKSKIGLDKPGPSLTGMQSRSSAAADRIAKLGPIPTEGLFTGLGMADARQRGFAGGRTSLPPVLPPAGLVGAPTPGPAPMSEALRKLLEERNKEADRIAKIFAQARRTALGAGREKGDFASAEQQAALKIYTKDFDDLSAAQQKVADALARIIVGGERAAVAQAAHRKELEAHTRATQDATKHAHQLHAAMLDLAKQVREGGPAAHPAAAAAKYPLADPGAQALERGAQAEYDRVRARLDVLNKARSEARNAEAALRKLWAGPAKLPDDPQLNALNARTKAASDAAAALRKYHEEEKQAPIKAREAFRKEAEERIRLGRQMIEQQEKEAASLFEMAGSTVVPKNALEALRMQAEKLRKELGNDEGFANFDKGMKNLTASLHKQENAAQKFARSFSEAFQQQFEGMFTHLMEHGFKGFFKSVVQGFSQMLQQIAAQILAAKLTDLIFGGANADTGQRAGGLIDVIARIFSHGHAMGGPVMAGVPTMVGERGRELFVPSSSGTIVPNNQLAAAGAGGGGVHIVVHVAGEQLPNARRNASAMAQQIGRELNRQQRRNGNG